jgi:hypothetical protein
MFKTIKIKIIDKIKNIKFKNMVLYDPSLRINTKIKK